MSPWDFALSEVFKEHSSLVAQAREIEALIERVKHFGIELHKEQFIESLL